MKGKAVVEGEETKVKERQSRKERKITRRRLK